jgi:tetratricopeptide (TPR) repeat protein
MWAPSLIVVALMIVNLATGRAFDPRPPLKPPRNVSPLAALAGEKDRDRPPAAAPAAEMMAQGERLGGIMTSSVDAEAAAKKVESLREQLKVNPKDYRLNYELANALYDAGDVTGAIASYRKAIELNAKFVKAYVNLGETLRERGDSQEAIDILEKALTIDAKDDVAHAALGYAYYNLRRYPDAMGEFKKALEINPRSVHATYYMGMAFADAQIYREAIKWWDKVCEIDPNADACFEARENNQLLRSIVN